MTLRRFKTAALLLCAACLVLAGWMLFHSLTGVRMVGCGAGSGCDSVMGSPWAYVLGGIPVSLPAAVASCWRSALFSWVGRRRRTAPWTVSCGR